MFLVNSRLGLFSAACSRRLPFSLGYGVILPSSLTTVLSLALGFSPHLPVSVCGTGTLVLLEAFPGSLNDSASLLYFHSPSQITIVLPDLPGLTRFLLGHALPTACSAYPPVSPHHSNNLRWYRNFYLLSIAYGFRPRLRPRLTLSGRTFLRKP